MQRVGVTMIGHHFPSVHLTSSCDETAQAFPHHFCI